METIELAPPDLQANWIERLHQDHGQMLAQAAPNAPLRTLWQCGMDMLQQRALPTDQDEHWRFLRLDITARDMVPVQRSLSTYRPDIELGDDTLRLVFIDGALDRSASTIVELSRHSGVHLEWLLPDGLPLGPGLQARTWLTETEGDHRYVALNHAFLTHGLWIRLANDVRLSKPLHIHHVESGAVPVALYPKWLIDLGARAEMTLVEHHQSRRANRPTSHVQLLHAQLGAGARLNHRRWLDLSAVTLDLNHIQVSQADDAHYQLAEIATGNGTARTTLDTQLVGRGAVCTTSSVALPVQTGQYNLSTRVRHLRPDTHSRQTGRFIAADKARAIFDSQVLVAKSVPGSSAEQSGRGLLASPGAEIILRPQLELYHSDIQCHHGASIGQIDNNALLYLTQRGIDAITARHMLISAFIADAVPDELPTGWAAKLDAAIAELLEHRRNESGKLP